MDQNERKLHAAAVEGSVTSLLSLLQEDNLILDRFLAGCYTETPLHISAMLGHLEFTKEILRRKPRLAGELDFRRSSPLHLATANGHLEVAKALLSVKPDMCLALDRFGRNPLHIAVIKGHVEVLTELVQAKPEAAQVRVDRGETILHLCVKHYQLEALKVLVEKINDDELVNAKDDDSFTVLHLAVADKQIESTKFLITKTTIDVNALNCNGFTALDIALVCSQRGQKDIDIRDSLQCAGAVRAQDTSSSSVHELENISTRGLSLGTTNQTTALRPKGRRTHNQHHTKQKQWLESKRNALMVVASLIATMAFQAGINPPGGVWQDDQKSGGDKKNSAGHSIMANTNEFRYALFLAYNTTGFLASISVILLLISGMAFKFRFFVWTLMVILWVAIISMVLTYSISIGYLIPEDMYHTLYTVIYVLSVQILAYYGLVGLLLLGHTIRLVIKMGRFARRMMRRRGESSNSIMMNQAIV